jgi:hypothetical protein
MQHSRYKLHVDSEAIARALRITANRQGIQVARDRADTECSSPLLYHERLRYEPSELDREVRFAECPTILRNKYGTFS